MGLWIKRWLRAWRDEPVVMSSPLPVEVVRERMAAATESIWQTVFVSGGGGNRIIGRVGKRRIRVSAMRPDRRNSWVPVLIARLESTESGSRLVGKLGRHPVVKAISGLVLAAAAAALVVVVAAFCRNPTAPGFFRCLATLGLLVIFCALMSWGSRAGSRETEYLRAWLTSTLAKQGTGIPGYRPRGDS